MSASYRCKHTGLFVPGSDIRKVAHTLLCLGEDLAVRFNEIANQGAKPNDADKATLKKFQKFIKGLEA